jgi:hypothetical protein
MSVMYGPDVGSGWDANQEAEHLLSTLPDEIKQRTMYSGVAETLAGIIGQKATTWEFGTRLRRGGSITILKVRTLPAKDCVRVLFTVENDYTPHGSPNLADWSLTTLDVRLDVFNREIVMQPVPTTAAGSERIHQFLYKIGTQFASFFNGKKLTQNWRASSQLKFRMPLSRLFPGSPWARLRGLEELPPGGGRLAAEQRKNQLALDLLEEERANDLDDAQEFADSLPELWGGASANTLPPPPWAEDRVTFARPTRNRAAGPTLLGRRP